MIGNDTATELDYLEKRKEIERKNLALQREIVTDLKELKEKATHIGKYVLVVGGVFIVTYWTIGFLFGSEEEDTSEKKIYFSQAAPAPEVVAAKTGSNPLLQAIMGHIATFLLAIAKEKLMEYLDNLDKNGSSKDTGANLT